MLSELMVPSFNLHSPINDFHLIYYFNFLNPSRWDSFCELSFLQTVILILTIVVCLRFDQLFLLQVVNCNGIERLSLVTQWNSNNYEDGVTVHKNSQNFISFYTLLFCSFHVFRPELSTKLQHLYHHRIVACLCLFYKYFDGKSSNDIRALIPPSMTIPSTSPTSSKILPLHCRDP